MIEQYIIGGLGTLIVGMCGAIWGKVNSIENKFDIFKENCRERHDTVVNTDEWLREHAKLESAVSALHRRMDAAGFSRSGELDRR